MIDDFDGPILPYGGGGKYVIKTAKELRCMESYGKPIFELDEARRNVERALTEIEERDKYLADIKAQIIWLLEWALPYGSLILEAGRQASLYAAFHNHSVYRNPPDSSSILRYMCRCARSAGTEPGLWCSYCKGPLEERRD